MLASLLESYSEKLTELEKRVGYRFKDRAVLLEALIHRSYAMEKALDVDNERLEFLGDAFLNFVVGMHIFSKHPELREGGLTKERAKLVREEALAWAAERIGLGEFLLLGKGEERQNGRTRLSNLADAFEALVGAVLVDGGIVKARALVNRLLLKAGVPNIEDYKSMLYDTCRRYAFPLPVFRCLRDGSLVKAEVKLNGFRAVVFGRSKKEAERVAAGIVYKHLLSRMEYVS